MSKQNLATLHYHNGSAARQVQATDDPELAELAANLRAYLSVTWRRDIDERQARQSAIRLLAASEFSIDRLVSQPLIEWLSQCVPAPLQQFLRIASARRGKTNLNHRVARKVPGTHFDSPTQQFETFLQEIDPDQRRRAGVFYTPRPVVRFIVSHVHQILKREFGLSNGLADTSNWEVAGYGEENATERCVQLLDPAVGTGVFLVEAVDVIHREFVSKWSGQGLESEEVRRRWNRYVPVHLLPRLTGVELMPEACLLASLNLALKLVETGYNFEEHAPINLYVADSLAGPFEANESYARLPNDWQAAVRRAFAACQESTPTVVIGNPPYAALSNSSSAWIEDLIRGRLPHGASTGSYYEVDGRALNERKLWLHDDYVKFMRFGQWKIEQAGAGILGFVTNHGYLDNPTFRGMRQQLLGAFSSISLVDLHGNAKKKETSIAGRLDQNVFDVEQGVAIGLFRKMPERAAAARIDYEDVWGTREKKYDWLERRAEATTQSVDDDGVATGASVRPVAPYYFFVPRDLSLDAEYGTGIPLTEVMPVNTSAVVTARDSFVIAFQREELADRIARFRDLTIPDEVIRRRYFSNTRSRKYPPGDTRGWKLSEARRRVAADENWESRIRECLYRPFDKRFIFWSADMIDWPRQEVSRHFVGHENLALIARRQMLPTQPCRYFWVADDLVLDGVIRSDNRGNETVFPLYLYEDRQRANLSSQFVHALSQRLSMTWIEDGCGDLRSTLGPEDVLHYIYAMFHSSEYRERYANQLRVEFPRVFFPRTVDSFRSLCSHGRTLVKSHLVCEQFRQLPNEAAQPDNLTDSLVARGYPKFKDQCVHINTSTRFEGVAESVWDFHAGGHQVCRKWLKDRRGRPLTVSQQHAYREIVSAIGHTLEASKQIDQLICRAGGWQHAFELAKTV